MRPVTLRVAVAAAVLTVALVPALATGSSSRGSAMRTIH
jgi:hypothetical protein